MRIIDGKRDYYDHLVGKYGFDETRVYDRRTDPLAIPYSHPGKEHITNGTYLIAITGELFPVVMVKKKFIFDPLDPDLGDNNRCKEFLKIYGPYRSTYSDEGSRRCSTDVNKVYRQPVLMCDENGPKHTPFSNRGRLFIPKLSDYGIPKVLSADEAYTRIYNFLGWLVDNPPIPDNQTDKEKVKSHGFDPKTSFRPNIKQKK